MNNKMNQKKNPLIYNKKISFLRIQFFIIMQPSILPYVTLTTQEALKWTLCDL